MSTILWLGVKCKDLTCWGFWPTLLPAHGRNLVLLDLKWLQVLTVKYMNWIPGSSHGLLLFRLWIVRVTRRVAKADYWDCWHAVDGSWPKYQYDCKVRFKNPWLNSKAFRPWGVNEAWFQGDAYVYNHVFGMDESRVDMLGHNVDIPWINVSPSWHNEAQRYSAAYLIPKSWNCPRGDTLWTMDISNWRVW